LQQNSVNYHTHENVKKFTANYYDYYLLYTATQVPNLKDIIYNRHAELMVSQANILAVLT